MTNAILESYIVCPSYVSDCAQQFLDKLTIALFMVLLCRCDMRNSFQQFLDKLTIGNVLILGYIMLFSIFLDKL